MGDRSGAGTYSGQRPFVPLFAELVKVRMRRNWGRRGKQN